MNRCERLALMAGIMLSLTSTGLAATKCRMEEYPDHLEAVCVGDEVYAVAPDKASSHFNVVTAPNISQNIPLQERDRADIMPVPVPVNRLSSAVVVQDTTQKVLSFRKHRLTRVELEAKKSVRMKTIQEERLKQPGPNTDFEQQN